MQSSKIILLCFVPLAIAYMGPKMGVISDCDDAEHGNGDYDMNDLSLFQCTRQCRIQHEKSKPTLFELPNFDAKEDKGMYHHCMNESISYDEDIPLRGPHRPNWGIYGEYVYIPVQRWLHNLEHGAIVLLYHPCADLSEVDKLRKIVTGCVFRHVITPYGKLTEKQPLALVAWGAKLQMSTVDAQAEQMAVHFIKNHSRVSPEDLHKQGNYKTLLVIPAKVVSDIDDNDVCPHTRDGTNFVANELGHKH